ncbi:biotin/lipoyl-binding protein [Modestobacter sp. I12A-02628]|uniref:Efflux RND transporter periplasmic adaptor subunit n=1 Tax=Goekera deserti TaxID=2497753 RepID=A0A7K3WD99_9ACTN|nr:efflux RND transporter periplasmic adaptor subunit [Goekera deserti]MPQ96799.1 biotin/lipoyl-binding protein [Goekera deserti]NDI46887.1 biotin/lipoyl-binding protein [Goekera deserti]NEL54455.1 efflux RND transporter periplasmic adaptor subunit [Goekera deserti]
MRVLRSVVFPTLRLLVWGVIAVALVVLAFRGGTGTDATAAGSGGPAPVDLASPAVPVTVGTVQNTVSVTGTVVADPAVPVKATAAGKVRRVLVEQGEDVAAGDALFEITVTTERDPVTTKDAMGVEVVTPRPPLVTRVTVPAPTAGRVATLDVLVDQLVAVGDAAGTISPGTLSISAPLTQADQFRLLSPPTTAAVTVQGGPAPFTCTGLTLGTPETAADPAGAPPGGAPYYDPSSGGATTGTTARCTVPAGTPVFAGMSAGVEVAAGTAVDVLTLPITAVQGSVQSGNVWVVGPDGEQVQTPVTLGLNDGQQVEVTGGLTEGQQVLQFVPIPDDTPVDGGMYGGFGG